MTERRRICLRDGRSEQRYTGHVSLISGVV